ncbi:MAG: hypothetical protein R2834_04190 [Rhodothermales bacterium]
MGYLPEHTPLYHDMQVYDYLSFVAAMRGAGRRPIKAHRPDGRLYAAWAPCSEKIDAPSKGYRQRVGPAQAMIHNPPIVILDEPTSGLDPNQIVEIRSSSRPSAQSGRSSFPPTSFRKWKPRAIACSSSTRARSRRTARRTSCAPCTAARRSVSASSTPARTWPRPGSLGKGPHHGPARSGRRDAHPVHRPQGRPPARTLPHGGRPGLDAHRAAPQPGQLGRHLPSATTTA